LLWAVSEDDGSIARDSSLTPLIDWLLLTGHELLDRLDGLGE
jgi:hypothetical protein